MAVFAEVFPVGFVSWVYFAQKFIEMFTVVFVFDVSELMTDQVVDDFGWSHYDAPVVREDVFGGTCSPASAVGTDLDFRGSEDVLFCEFFGAFCEVMERFVPVPFCQEFFCVDWWDNFFTKEREFLSWFEFVFFGVGAIVFDFLKVFLDPVFFFFEKFFYPAF